MNKTTELLQGTLDLLILKAVSLGPLHGYGVLLRLQQISKDTLFRSRMEPDMDREMRFHIQVRADDL
jgi:DNA-binding PadR family transcriptional regulator